MSDSKTAEITAWLMSGKYLTSMIAWQMWNITRLASIIHRLRRSGYNITTEIVDNHAVYRLIQGDTNGV